MSILIGNCLNLKRYPFASHKPMLAQLPYQLSTEPTATLSNARPLE